MNGKKITIFLVNGTPNGILTADIGSSWTGKVIVVPRTQLADFAKRDEGKGTGIYVLSGEDPDNPLKERVYIGESDDVFKRLKRHNETKDFWNRAVIVISMDENLTKAHVRYLESRLIHITNQARRATLDNDTSPDAHRIPEPDTADMEYSLAQIQTLLPVLGFTFALPVPTSQMDKTSKSEIGPISAKEGSPLFDISRKGLHAEAREINGEFIVLKGSMARKNPTQSLRITPSELRTQLRKDGKLVDALEGDYWIFAVDVPFSSPSSAATIITGNAVNGRTIWKITGTQQTYREWQEAKIEEASKIQPSGTSGQLETS